MDASWLIILALLTLSPARAFPDFMGWIYGEAAPALPPYEYWIMGLISALAFFVCILLHELGHAVVARAAGHADPRHHSLPVRRRRRTRRRAGLGRDRVSHGHCRTRCQRRSWASVFWLLAWAGYHAGGPPLVVMILGYLGIINLLVLVFNLIPAFPLDGGRVLRSILWGATGNLRRATYWASLAGQAFAWLLIAWGMMQFFTVNWLGGIWSGLIGLFLNRAAQSGYQQVLIRQALQGEPVRRFMNPNRSSCRRRSICGTGSRTTSTATTARGFPVASNGHLEGLISTPEAGADAACRVGSAHGRRG